MPSLLLLLAVSMPTWAEEPKGPELSGGPPSSGEDVILLDAPFTKGTTPTPPPRKNAPKPPSSALPSSNAPPMPTASNAPSAPLAPMEIVSQPIDVEASAAPVLPPPPFQRWYFQGDALWLTRYPNDNRLLVSSLSNGTVTNLVELDHSHYEMSAGMRLTLGHRIDENTAIEATYWGMQVMSINSRFQRTPGQANQEIFGATGLVNTFPGITNQDAGGNTRLNNAEFNAKRGLADRLNVIAGARYFRISDKLNIDEDGAVVTNGGPTAATGKQRIDVINDLLGVQVGGEVKTPTPILPRHLLVMGSLKGGLLANFASGDFTRGLSVPAAPGANFNASDGDRRIALATLLEGAAGIGVTVTRNFKLRGGYMVLFLDNVALASDQQVVAPAVPPLGGAQQTNANGNLFLHGPYCGGELSW